MLNWIRREIEAAETIVVATLSFVVLECWGASRGGDEARRECRGEARRWVGGDDGERYRSNQSNDSGGATRGGNRSHKREKGESTERECGRLTCTSTYYAAAAKISSRLQVTRTPRFVTKRAIYIRENFIQYLYTNLLLIPTANLLECFVLIVWISLN